MPNLCSYAMRVKGKRENIEEFVDVMTNYSLERHFWRVFRADAEYYDSAPDGLAIACIHGECAWSVYCCMCTGDWTYANDVAEERRTSLQFESRRLNLEIEVYSDEPGMEFQEHYRYRNGEELAAESVEYRCFSLDYIDDEATEEEKTEMFEEFKKENKLNPDLTLADLDLDGRFVVGGFGYWTFSL